MKRKQQELLSDGYVLSQGNLSNCVQIMSHFFCCKHDFRDLLNRLYASDVPMLSS